jgi:hypothetical protein
MPREAIYIGATIVGAPDADEYFGPVKVPGTMSKAATIEAHKTKVQTQRTEHVGFPPMGFADSVVPNDDKYENHAHRPMVGQLASVTITNGDGDPIYHMVGSPPIERGKVALPLVNYLTQNFPHQFSDSLRFGDAEPTAVFFGFNLKQVLRIAAFEALHRNLNYHYVTVHVPVRLWHNPIGVYDVLDVLLPKDDQRDLDLYSLMRYFGIQVDAEQLANSSQSQATAARLLVEQAQLVPTGG